jgi:hypothetical protein
VLVSEVTALMQPALMCGHPNPALDEADISLDDSLAGSRSPAAAAA